MNNDQCPFCGDTDPQYDEITPGVLAMVCNACGCIGPHDVEVQQNHEQALEAWRGRK